MATFKAANELEHSLASGHRPFRRFDREIQQEDWKSTSSRNDMEQERESLDFTQRIERKLAKYNASDNLVKRWLLEIVCWMISAACMGAIIGIYLQVNGRPLARQQKLLTLANALGKTSSAALIVPTSEALGQLKWNWFHNSKAMWDFEIFDKASRGPWGAIMLLYRTRGRSLAALGALLIVLLLAIDTFFQQVVVISDEWTLEGAAGVLPKTTRYESQTNKAYTGGVEGDVDDRDMFLVVELFGYGNGTQPVPFGNGTRPDIPLSCPTSNCTWPVYNTLGVCSECEDISNLLTFACLTSKLDWTANTTAGPTLDPVYPDASMCGYFLNASSEKPILMSGYLGDEEETPKGEILLGRSLPLTTAENREPLYGNGSIHFKHLRNTIIDFVVVSSASGMPDTVNRKQKPVAQECVLTWCVKTIQSSYDSGTYNEEVVKKVFNTTAGPFPWESTPYEDEFGQGTITEYTEDININIVDHTAEPDSHAHYYGLSKRTAIQNMVGFWDVFPSFSTIGVEFSASPILRYKTWPNDTPWTQEMEMNPWLAPNNVSRHMERFATALTNVVRSSRSREELVGQAFRKEGYVHIRWEWLTFPFILLVLSLVFLASTIVKTSKDTGAGVWKTSTMPTIMYGLPQDTKQQFASSGTWKTSQADAKKVRIKLLPHLGWRVSGQSMRSEAPMQVPQYGKAPPGWI